MLPSPVGRITDGRWLAPLSRPLALGVIRVVDGEAYLDLEKEAIEAMKRA